MKWKDVRRRCERWESTTLRLMGLIELIFGAMLLVPAAFAMWYGDDATPFLAPIPPLLVLGAIQYLSCGESRTSRSVNGLMLVAVCWLLMFAIGTLPYLLSGISLVDAVFESVSGLTTTGLSVMGDLSGKAISLLIWRSLTQWVGGITVVLIFLYFLPRVGQGRTLFYNELAGSGSSEYSQRTRTAARSFIFIYAVLSAINLALLLLLGVAPVEAMCLMFTTISTGGLLIFNGSMAGYSDPVQWVTVVFMFLGGTNFYLHYRSIYRRQRGVYRGNSEFRTMLGWFAGISLVVFLLLLQSMHASGTELTLGGAYETLKDVVFTTVSLGTTTGFYVDDYTQWPSQCLLLLMLVAFIGASASSTSGGLKVGRLRILYEYVRNGFRGMIHTNAVYSVKVDGRSVDDSVVSSALVVFMMYVMTLLVGGVIFMIAGYDMVDSIGLSISAVSNGGMGFGNFGPTGDFAGMDDAIKIVLVVLMWIGRLEVVTALIMLTPGFWKDVWLGSRARRRERHARSRERSSVPLAIPEDVDRRPVAGRDLVYGPRHDARLVVLALLRQADAQGLHGAHVAVVLVDGPGGEPQRRLRVAHDPHHVRREGVGLGRLVLEAGPGVLGRLLLPPGHDERRHVGAAGVEVIRMFPEQPLGYPDGLLVVPQGAPHLRQQLPVERRRRSDRRHRLQCQLVLLHVLQAEAG